jgi:hypothetical protein
MFSHHAKHQKNSHKMVFLNQQDDFGTLVLRGGDLYVG